MRASLSKQKPSWIASWYNLPTRSRKTTVQSTIIDVRELNMKRMLIVGIVAMLFASAALGQDSTKPATADSSSTETRYLAFQVFTNFTTDPRDARTLNNGMKEPLVPGTVALRDYVLDIKQRIGAVGDTKARLAVMLGPLCFDQSDAETTRYIEQAFDLALETDLALGFHVDDSMFWRSRQDLWSDPQNVEALDWDGTPCKSRRLNWSKEPSEAPPQMCFNSRAVQREVQQRSTLIGMAIQAGVKKLQERNKPELFAGVIVGWETMIGQDFETGKYLGYRALMNRGFSREQPPKDMDLEREKVVQEFIERWATGIADAGVSPNQIYSHTAFLSRRAFNSGNDKDITYMKNDMGNSYSQHNHFAPPSVTFGKNHRPGFSTYPQPGLFEDIYELVDEHKQLGWASCEGTNMQPGTGPGQTGMNMETYLAKMFNHGATLTTVFSWGIGGEAMKNMSFRVCTESEEALQAYRKFLKGEPLIEGEIVAGLMERLPPKIHRIQKEFPTWLEKANAGDKEQGVALMQKLQGQYKAKNFEEVEKAADEILKLMGVNVPVAAQVSDSKPSQAQSNSPPSSDTRKRLTEKVERVKAGFQKWAASGRDPSEIGKTMGEEFKPLMEAGKVVEAEAVLDRVLEQLAKVTSEPASSPAPTVPQEASSLEKRLPPKIQRIQKELSSWLEKADADNKQKAIALMHKLKEQMDAKNFEEVEKTADAILKLIGTSASTSAGTSAAPSGSGVSEEARRQMRHNIDSNFVVFRDKVQEELKLTTAQKEKLEVVLPDVAQFLQKLQGLKPEDRKNEIKAYRPKAREKLAAVVKETLDEGQRTRLRQLVLQREGLRNGEVWRELQVTDEQQKQFMALIRQGQQDTQSLMAELHKSGKLKEMQPKIIKVRDDLDGQLNALLTDAQKKQWQEMLGKPMAMADLFDL
jgi:hypothetical protein